jgi:F-type H+-transporting ATPase subunit a
MTKRFPFALAVLAAVAAGASAQEHAATPAAVADTAHSSFVHCAPHVANPGPSDIIMPHLVDSKHLEIPWACGVDNWMGSITLPTWYIPGTQIDIGPTKHVVFLLIAGTLATLILIGAARAHKRHSHAAGHPKGFAAGIEAVILYLRNEIYLPVLGGHGGEKYVPFCLTLFFFIAIANLLGLLPYGSTATGNVAVTATLAIITFLTVEIAGMRTLGKGYFGTVFYWPHDQPLALKGPLTLVMTPVEIIGKFTKPFALTIRLFANMVAGHVIILALIGLIFMFGWAVALGAVPMALFIMTLELLVVFIQAFIFSLLAAVFIGQIRAAHH